MKTLDMSDVLLQYLRDELRSKIELELKHDLLEKFQKEIEPLVKAAAQRVTVETVESFIKAADLSQQLEINISWCTDGNL